MKKSTFITCLLATMVLAIWQCKEPAQVIEKGTVEHIRQVTGAVDDAKLAAQETEHGDWLTYGRNYKEDRYSKLDQINKSTLKDLSLAWTLNVNTKRGIQGTPLVVDGIMFATGPWSVLWAIDARKGTKLWEYDPKTNRERAIEYCCGVINRGPAMYKGLIIWGTLDGRLIAVDAATGEKKWEQMTIPESNEEFQYSITGAPRIANGKVLIGNGGAEYTARGYVTAYDAMTGKQVWRFYTVPGDPSKPFENPILEEAAKTWNGEWWANGGGGGTAWDAITFDPELNTVYIGVGNGTHWNQEIRSPGGGDNLFLASILALDADTGKYKWHFQQTPGDTWDYTSTQPMTMAEIEIEGKMRKVIMQAPKNGFFYVIDRVTGEFISGDNYAYMNWAAGLDENGRPIEREGARYKDGKTHWIAPSSHGAHNWHPQAYNRKLGLVYIPTLHQAGPYARVNNAGAYDKDGIGGPVGINASMTGKLYNPTVFDPNPKAPKPGTGSGRLIAYDPIKHEEVWAIDQPSIYNAGLLTTEGGLLFQMDATGTFSARDAQSGESLWSYDTRAGGIAPPITYLIDGEQYITVPVGWGGGQGQTKRHFKTLHPGTIYTFKLGGTATPPEKLDKELLPLTSLSTDAPPHNIGNGWDLFVQLCIACHNLGKGGGALPDLARSSDAVFENYNAIIREGMLASQGMPNLGEHLTEEDVEDIKSYIIHTAGHLRQGTDPLIMMKELAEWQYLSDTQGPVRKDIR